MTGTITMRALMLGAALALAAPAAPLLAQTPAVTAPEVLALGETLRIDGVIAVMRDEGLEYGRTLRIEMLPEAPALAWQAEVSRIYDAAAMRAVFDTALSRALAGDSAVLTAAQRFFGDQRGQKILRLELEARRALLDDAVEAAAQEAARQMAEEATPRHDLLRRFAETNDLIELNVMGALNANLAFYKGLSQGGAFGQAMPEDDMLAEVWAQEPDLRRETEDWLWPYLSLAYGPLSDEELQAYIAFSASPEGQRLNSAIFAAFDELFVAISLQLGLAAGRQLQGQDI